MWRSIIGPALFVVGMTGAVGIVCVTTLVWKFHVVPAIERRYKSY